MNVATSTPWRNKYLVSALVVVLTSGYLLHHFWLFREITDLNPALGRMTFKFRWGYAHEIERDVDQDGKVDQRLFLPPESDGFYHHDVPEEIWIDDDHDGRFEGRGQFDGQGILRIEIDADGDGIPELTLGQAEARKYLNERHYSPSWKREHEH